MQTMNFPGAKKADETLQWAMYAEVPELLEMAHFVDLAIGNSIKVQINHGYFLVMSK